MKDIQNEEFVVVNEKDEIIGYRTRYDCHHDKTLIHRAVDVVLFNTEGNIAMQKRSTQKDLYPGFFCITASGHVSRGESREETAYRELKEEMGVEGIPLERRETFMVSEEHETEMISLFVGIYDGSFIYPSDEVQSVRFFTPSEVKKLTPLTASTIESLKRLNIL